MSDVASPTAIAAAPFPFRLAACDLDGTLLGPDKTIGPANLAAVAALRNHGVEVIVVSGRRHTNSVHFHRQLGLRPGAPIVSCLGARVATAETDEIWSEHPLPPDLSAELVREGRARGFSVIRYGREHLRSDGRTKWTELYASRVGEQPEVVADPDQLGTAGALKLVWYGEPETLRALRPDLEERFRGRLELLPTDPENLEFVAAGVNKAAALALVAGRLGVERAATLAFGDGESDAPMLEWSGLGVVMPHAGKRARAAARLVAPSGDEEASAFARAVDIVLGMVR